MGRLWDGSMEVRKRWITQEGEIRGIIRRGMKVELNNMRANEKGKRKLC